MVRISAKHYSSIKDRGLGLIGHKQAEPVLFYTRFGIHTLGLKFPIDVLVLGKDFTVVKLRKNLKPNSFFVWPVKYNKVLELPEGYIEKKRIKLGTKINLNILIDLR